MFIYLSKVDMWLKLPTLCEIGELVIAVEVSCSPETSPGTALRRASRGCRRCRQGSAGERSRFAGSKSGNCVTSGGIVVADAVDKGSAMLNDS